MTNPKKADAHLLADIKSGKRTDHARQARAPKDNIPDYLDVMVTRADDSGVGSVNILKEVARCAAAYMREIDTALAAKTRALAQHAKTLRHAEKKLAAKDGLIIDLDDRIRELNRTQIIGAKDMGQPTSIDRPPRYPPFIIASASNDGDELMRARANAGIKNAHMLNGGPDIDMDRDGLLDLHWEDGIDMWKAKHGIGTDSAAFVLLDLEGPWSSGLHDDDPDVRALIVEQRNDVKRYVMRNSPHLIVGDYGMPSNRMTHKARARDNAAMMPCMRASRALYVQVYVDARRSFAQSLNIIRDVLTRTRQISTELGIPAYAVMHNRIRLTNINEGGRLMTNAEQAEYIETVAAFGIFVDGLIWWAGQRSWYRAIDENMGHRLHPQLRSHLIDERPPGVSSDEHCDNVMRNTYKITSEVMHKQGMVERETLEEETP